MERVKLTGAYINGLHSEDKRLEIYDDIVTGMAIRVTPTGHKSFVFRYKYDGVAKRYTIGRYGTWSLAEARNKAKELKKLVDEGIDPVQEKKIIRETKPETLRQVVGEYKDKHLSKLKKSTQTDYEYKLEVILKGLGADKSIKNIQRYEVLDFLDSKAKKSPTQAKRLQAVISGIFKFAQDRGWVEKNVAARINLAGKYQRKKKWQNQAYNEEEIKKLWQEFGKWGIVGYYFKMLMTTGQRSGETRKMKWSDIDFDKRLWTISGSDTKNGLTHYVPLTALSMDILEELKPWTGKSNWVFASDVKKGEHIGYQSWAARQIRKVSKVDFNAHSLRTTVATQLAGLGTPPQVLSKILNHKRPGEGSIITAIYNRYDYEDEKRKALQTWNDQLERILSGEAKAKMYRL